MFFAATLIMMPVVVVLMMVNASIGVITRSAPQLNLFSFGFPISMLAAFFILFLSAGALGEASSNLISAAINSLEDLIEGLHMAEDKDDSQEKTEDPSQRKLDKARRTARSSPQRRCSFSPVSPWLC